MDGSATGIESTKGDDMKIELDLPQVPEGWRFLGWRKPKEGQGYIAFPDEGFCISSIDFVNEECLTFERIEPEVDTELEEAKKLIGTWVTYKRNDPTLFLVESVVRVNTLNVKEFDNGKLTVFFKGGMSGVSYESCTPFPLPRWRCCESDKPKKEKRYAVRCKDNRGRYNCADYRNLKWVDRWGTEYYGTDDYEWLDEGEQ